MFKNKADGGTQGMPRHLSFFRFYFFLNIFLSVRWLSELVSQNGDTWTERGNITFPSGDVLNFASVGEGHSFSDFPNPGDGYGGVSNIIFFNLY